jgi:dipeptidyl aminopeptidase/acylaminoacyl peptidase
MTKATRILWALLIAGFCIATNAAPPAKPSEPLPLSVYSAEPGIEQVALSLTGKYLAFVTSVKDMRLLVVAEVGGKVLHKIALGDLNLEYLNWAGDDFVLIHSRSAQKLGYSVAGHFQLHNLLVVNRHSGKLDVPLSNSKKVFNAAFHFYMPVQKKGRWYQCLDTLSTNSSTYTRQVWINDSEFQLSCIDLKSGRVSLLAGSREDGDGWLLGPGLQVLATASYDELKQEWRLQRDWRSQALYTASSRYGGHEIEGQGRTPGTLIFSANAEHYYEVPLNGGKPSQIYADAVLEWLYFDPVTGLNNGYLKVGDVPELVMLDPLHKARIEGARKAFPNLNVHFRSWNQDVSRLVVYTDGDTDSGTWWLVDIAAGSAEILGVNHPLIKSAYVAPFKMWQYKAADGLDIHAVLTLPPGKPTEKQALIVLPHGGPESRDYLRFDWLAQAFASRGYVVLQANFRGSDGYGSGFRNAGFGEFGRKMQSDLSDGVAALAEAGVVDPARVCIVGGSYGGYAALAGVSLQKDIYRCAVSIAGISDLPLFLSEMERNRSHAGLRYWKDYLGVTSSKDDSLQALSPRDKAKRIHVPVLLIHGEYDTVVPVEQSRLMARRLKSLDLEYRYVELETEDHYLSQAATRLQALEEAIAFVMTHNPPD